MDSDKNAPRAEREASPLSEAERKALVSEWRKTKPDLSWQPLEGRELDRLLPLKNKLLRGFVGVVMIGGVLLVLAALLSTASAPPEEAEEAEEVKATVAAVGKRNSDGYVTVVVDVDGEMPATVTYHGSKPLKQGQRVVLEKTTSRISRWTNYRFKDPPDS